MAKIWIRGEYLLNAQLPLCPPSRIVTFNLTKMIAYTKSKATEGYPNITLELWRYLATQKLQISQELADTYFEIVKEYCKSIPSLSSENAESPNNSEYGKKTRVSLLGLAVFLFVQQANRLNLRASMSGLERRPRTYSEQENRPASRRSSFGGTFGQENIESKITEFLSTHLQSLLELLAVNEGELKDYHDAHQAECDTLTFKSLIALDLIFEGSLSDSTTILPFSALAISERSDWALKPIRLRQVEHFIREALREDPFTMAVPYADLPLEGSITRGGAGSFRKRSSSENRLLSDFPSARSTGDIGQITPRNGRIVHNGKTAPQSHRLIIMQCMHRQTLGRNSELLTDSVFHIGKCFHSHFYFLSQFKSVVIRRCRGTMLFIGPTSGIVRLQNCYDCTLIVMCRRLLISDCQNCTIYAKTPLRPLILGSTNAELTFGPYCSFYGDLEKHMIAAGISKKPDRWMEPLVLGNGERGPKDPSAQPCWRLMAPKDFYPISIPFKSQGATKSIPGGLPSDYKQALEERQSFFTEWNQFTATLNEDERQITKEFVEKEYMAWLEKSGRMEELLQLRKLEARQRKRQAIKK